MIAYQKELLREWADDVATDKQQWCNDDWETPDCIAKFMASLIKTDEKAIVEPAAGTGQIAKYLTNPIDCIELNSVRYIAGMALHSQHEWHNGDFLELAGNGLFDCSVDLVIGNPPFSRGMEFLKASAKAIWYGGRILFLLPSEFFQSQARAKALAETGLSITHQWAIAGRVGYLKNGTPYNQRQCYDSIFELKLTGEPVIEIVNRKDLEAVA